MTARRGGKKNEKPDQTEQPKEADMICISKQDLEGMLKDMLADMKGKEHNSNDKSQFSGKPTGTNNENNLFYLPGAWQYLQELFAEDEQEHE